MNDNHHAIHDRDTLLDDFAAELARAAYYVALRHETPGTWLDLELDLWRALADTVKQEWPQATRQLAAARSESVGRLRHGPDPRLSHTGE